ncbi:hypothetical protein [Pseudorhodobacter aquimaris]|nr:hypothetical protein [Pseudorhodobacter aquimaris]
MRILPALLVTLILAACGADGVPTAPGADTTQDPRIGEIFE